VTTVAQKTQFYKFQRERQNFTPCDPWTALAAGILVKAIDDLRVGDPLVKLDAALWLQTDAPEWLNFLGIN
jgi:hypothetical protein